MEGQREGHLQQGWAHPGHSVTVAVELVELVEPVEPVVGAVDAVAAAASHAFAADETGSSETTVNPW